MKRLCLSLLLSLAAVSVQAQGADADAASQPRTQDQEDAAVVITGGAAETVATAKADTKANCVRETGSRIKRRDAKGCNGEPGRSYDREDLERTGAIDAADALRRLDPAIGR